MKIKFNAGYTVCFIVVLIIEIFIAMFIHDGFIRPYLGDVLVVVLIYCFLRIFLPPYRLLPLGIFIFAEIIEIAQFFDFVKLLGVQENIVLSVALGSTFDPADMVCYAVGGLLTYIWQRKNY